MQALTDTLIKDFDAELFAEMFLRSPLAEAMLERGESWEFFLPIQRRDGAEWGGFNITIAGVTKRSMAIGQQARAGTDRGNGYSRNPHGPLQPGDYGVHSHPDSAKLIRNGSAGA